MGGGGVERVGDGEGAGRGAGGWGGGGKGVSNLTDFIPRLCVVKLLKEYICESESSPC